VEQLHRKVALVVDSHNTSQILSSNPVKCLPQAVHAVPCNAFRSPFNDEILHVLVETKTVKPLLAWIFVHEWKLGMALLELYGQNVCVFQPVKLLESAFKMTSFAKKLAGKSGLLEFIVEVKICTWFVNIHLDGHLWRESFSLICSSVVVYDKLEFAIADRVLKSDSMAVRACQSVYYVFQLREWHREFKYVTLVLTLKVKWLCYKERWSDLAASHHISILWGAFELDSVG